MFVKLVFTCSLLFLLSCSDDATITLYEKNLPKESISCIQLVIFPPNKKIQNSLEKLYDFDENCNITMEVSTKSGITCNSNQNYQRKAVGSFPTSYLKMQVNDGSKIVYSYYIDLLNEVTQEDVSSAFSRVRDDLNIR